MADGPGVRIQVSDPLSARYPTDLPVEDLAALLGGTGGTVLPTAIGHDREFLQNVGGQIQWAPGYSVAATYGFSTNTSGAVPPAGYLSLNNATQNAATILTLSPTDTALVDWTSVFAKAAYVHIADAVDASRWLFFRSSGFSSAGGKLTLTGTVLAASEASPLGGNRPLSVVLQSIKRPDFPVAALDGSRYSGVSVSAPADATANHDTMLAELTALAAAGGGIYEVPPGPVSNDPILWTYNLSNLHVRGREGPTALSGGIFTFSYNDSPYGTTPFNNVLFASYLPCGTVLGPIGFSFYDAGVTSFTAIYGTGGGVTAIRAGDPIHVVGGPGVDGGYLSGSSVRRTVTRKVISAVPSGGPTGTSAVTIDSPLPTSGMGEADLTGHLTGGALTSVTIDDGGIYGTSTPPVVTVSGDGSGAAVMLTMTKVGENYYTVTGYSITTAGSSYTTIKLHTPMGFFVSALVGGIPIVDYDFNNGLQLASGYDYSNVVPGAHVKVVVGWIINEPVTYSYTIQSYNAGTRWVTFVQRLDRAVYVAGVSVLLPIGWGHHNTFEKLPVDPSWYHYYIGQYHLRVDGGGMKPVGSTFNGTASIMHIQMSQDVVVSNFQGLTGGLSSSNGVTYRDCELWQLINHVSSVHVRIEGGFCDYLQAISGARDWVIQGVTFRGDALMNFVQDVTFRDIYISHTHFGWFLGGDRIRLENISCVSNVEPGIQLTATNCVVRNVHVIGVIGLAGSSGRYGNVDTFVDETGVPGAWVHDPELDSTGTLTTDDYFGVNRQLKAGSVASPGTVTASGGVGAGLQTPEAYLHARAPASVIASQRLETVVGSLNVFANFGGAGVTVGDTSAHVSYAITLENNHEYLATAVVTGRDPGSGHGATFELKARVKTSGGSATVMTPAAEQKSFTDADDPSWDSYFTASGLNLQVSHVGVAGAFFAAAEVRVRGWTVNVVGPDTMASPPTDGWEARLGKMWQGNVNTVPTVSDGDPVHSLVPVIGGNVAVGLGSPPVFNAIRGLDFSGANNLAISTRAYSGKFTAYLVAFLKSGLPGTSVLGVLASGAAGILLTDATIQISDDLGGIFTNSHTLTQDAVILVRIGRDGSNVIHLTGAGQSIMAVCTDGFGLTFNAIGPPYLGDPAHGWAALYLVSDYITPGGSDDLIMRNYLLNRFASALDLS